MAQLERVQSNRHSLQALIIDCVHVSDILRTPFFSLQVHKVFTRCRKNIFTLLLAGGEVDSVFDQVAGGSLTNPTSLKLADSLDLPMSMS